MEATHWGRWARQLPLATAIPLLVAPPLVGGTLVGALRALTSFDEATAGADDSRAQAQAAAVSRTAPEPLGSGSERGSRDRTAEASTSGRDGTAAPPAKWRFRQQVRRAVSASSTMLRPRVAFVR